MWSMSTAMARKRSEFEPDLKKLISKLSGFDESDENFQLCLQFARSNISYHRFLGVDSHKLTRSLEGLVTKFQINCQYDKAELLQSLTETFLESPVSKRYPGAKTDVHYSILQLLLHLADSPTNADYIKPGQLPEEAPAKEQFDWKGYLLEGEDTTRELYPESSDSCGDDDEPKEDSDSANQSTGKVVRFDEEEEPEKKPDDDTQGDNSVPDPTPSEPKHALNKGDNWLEENVMVQYWKGMVETAAWADGQCSNLYTDWECYKLRTNPLYSMQYDVMITEYQMMRELIWLLGGVKQLFICHHQNGRFFIRPDLAMSHLTKESLQERLEVYFKHGSQVHQLQDFVRRITNSRVCYNNNSTSHDQVSLTFQAFAQCIAQFLQSFRKFLSQLEMTITKQEKIFSLHKLSLILQPWFVKLGVVYDVFHHGTEEGRAKGDNTVLAAKLLSRLYNTVLKYDGFSEESTDLASLLLSMLIQTSRPYLDIIDEWITKGTLTDPRKEFLIQRNESVKSLDESFWETAFSLRCPSTNVKVTSPSKEHVTVTSPGKDHPNVEDDKGTGKEGSYLAPKFLQPVMREVVLAGKSMELLQTLGRLGKVLREHDNEDVQCRSWYATFIESLRESLGNTPSPGSEAPPGGQKGEGPGDTRGVTLPSITEDSRHSYDPLLQINFSALVDLDCSMKNTTKADEPEKSVSELRLTGLVRVSVLLERCLYPYVHKRYQRVCMKLVEILTNEHHLLDYLDSIRRFYLMEAGDTLFDFYTELFQKVQCHEMWRDVYVLNMVLRATQEAFYPQDVNRLSIDIRQPSFKGKDSNPINAFDGLQLHYEVPWPLDIIISTKTREVYNQVFVFLLQIKYAKYSLDKLQFSVLERENLLRTIVQPEDAFSRIEDEDERMEDQLPRGHRVHRMQLLRMMLINFVNSLHTYIMTRILHSTGLEFMAEIKKAADLDQIITLHGGYVFKIHSCCLQHKDVEFLKDAILKVLNLCVIFSARWQHGVDEISSESIESLEREFGMYMQFLSSFLNNIVKRGSFSHLEPLAYALFNATEQKFR